VPGTSNFSISAVKPPSAVTYLDPVCLLWRRLLQTHRRPRPTVARFALDATVLPLVQDTLRIAELSRIVAMGCYRRTEKRRSYGGSTPEALPNPRSEVLSGKDELGKPLRGHIHAHYLPTDEDSDGRLDHLTIFAPMGFGRAEVRALDSMRQLKRDESEPIRLVLLALGQREAIAAHSLFGPSRLWVSATPFLATRHPKIRGRKKDAPRMLGTDNQREFARQVLIEEVGRLREIRPDLPEPVTIEPLNEEHRCSIRQLRPIQFRRFRRKAGDDGGRRSAGAFRIIFPHPVSGPLCLGHSSHFDGAARGGRAMKLTVLEVHEVRISIQCLGIALVAQVRVPVSINEACCTF
jgi:CRISPR-associated protein Csb2